MKTLQRIGTAVVLTFVLGLSALGGEIPTPPCDPGETHGPPCSAVSASVPSEMDTPGQIDTPPAAASDASFTEFAASVLVGIMSLF
jgi:hypothetical protein